MKFAALAAYRPRIEALLRAQFERERPRAPAPVRPYIDAAREFTLRGGKRFRAILVLAGYHIATGRAPDPALPAAAALEQFQSWMLVHDDIIDHAEERRGGPTVHRTFEREHAARRGGGTSADYGVGIGITLGDLEEPFTVDALLSVRAPPAARLAALAEYVRMTRATAYGQLLDVRYGTLPVGSVREADVLRVHELKSAIYTVASPLKIGALLAGTPERRLGDLEAVAIDLGIAFQLRDDILGAGFDAAESGKSANDLVEGKRTLLVIRAWAKADASGRARLARVLGNARASAADVGRARDVLRATGSLEYSEARIAALTRRAFARIGRSRTLRGPAKPLLREIAYRLVNRRA